MQTGPKTLPKPSGNDHAQKPQGPPVGSKPRRLAWVLSLGGFLSVGLGLAGIFLPLLPTTPFLLLAAALFARSSPRYYSWLLNNKWFGKYIRNYREGKGIPLSVKIGTLGFLWLTILSSALFAVSRYWLKAVLFLVAIAVTWHILAIKSCRRKSAGRGK